MSNPKLFSFFNGLDVPQLILLAYICPKLLKRMYAAIIRRLDDSKIFGSLPFFLDRNQVGNTKSLLTMDGRLATHLCRTL